MNSKHVKAHVKNIELFEKDLFFFPSLTTCILSLTIDETQLPRSPTDSESEEI